MDYKVDVPITASARIITTLFILLNQNVTYKEYCIKKLLINWGLFFFLLLL